MSGFWCDRPTLVTASTSGCRSCGRRDLKSVLSLGRTPLANAFLQVDQLDQPEPTYPLDLVFCPNCTLVQILETVPPEQLFGEYLYFSSFSETMLQHAEALARELIAARHLIGRNLVIEAASNDGYLLRHYYKAGIPILGIEPARNIAQRAQELGINTRQAYFGIDLARQLRAEGLRADVFHAHNVLAHVADLNGFVAGIRHILKDDGLAMIEVPYLKDLIEHCEFDTIYHEHLCYFSLTALDHCFRRHGLGIVDVRRIPIHGGSLRLYVVRAQRGLHCARVTELLAEEAAWGIDRRDSYMTFAAKVGSLKDELRGYLASLKQRGHRIAAYGASAKGTTLLNYCGIGGDILDFVVDRSSAKQGRYTPGSHLPILPPETLLEKIPDYTLLLTWNFADEILNQQQEYRNRGGRFILPVPEPRVA